MPFLQNLSYLMNAIEEEEILEFSLAMLENFHDGRHPLTSNEDLTMIAASRGKIRVLEWALFEERRIPFSLCLLVSAAYSGRVDVLKWAWEKCGLCTYENSMFFEKIGLWPGDGEIVTIDNVFQYIEHVGARHDKILEWLVSIGKREPRKTKEEVKKIWEDVFYECFPPFVQ